MCSSTQLSCGPQLWPSTTIASVHTHTPIHDGEYAHTASPKRTRQGNGTSRLQLSNNIQLHVRVVGDQNANRVLIRVRHCSRTSPWIPFGRCVAHGNAEFLQAIQFLGVRPAHFDLLQILQTTWSRFSTHWPQTHLGTSLPRASSDQFRTETTSLLTTMLCLIVDSTHSSGFSNETLNSSMMFSSLFPVVQSSSLTALHVLLGQL